MILDDDCQRICKIISVWEFRRYMHKCIIIFAYELDAEMISTCNKKMAKRHKYKMGINVCVCVCARTLNGEWNEAENSSTKWKNEITREKKTKKTENTRRKTDKEKKSIKLMRLHFWLGVLYYTTKYIAIAPKTLCYTFCSNSSDFLFGCHCVHALFFDYSYHIGDATKSQGDENDAIIIINNYRVRSHEYVCVCEYVSFLKRLVQNRLLFGSGFIFICFLSLFLSISLTVYLFTWSPFLLWWKYSKQIKIYIFYGIVYRKNGTERKWTDRKRMCVRRSKWDCDVWCV